uniref:DUF4176 domain-containing protein n=1 Tax=Strongyloides papillosus TaxID=174720 RepID=A0A0N5CIN3_STREA
MINHFICTEQKTEKYCFVCRKNISRTAAFRCFQPFGPDLSFISDKENVSAVIGDVTHPHPFLNVTGKCNQQITITGNLPDDLQEKKKRYYVGYYYSYELTLIVKKFPEDCKQKYERQSPYNCDFEELNPNKKKGMTDEEFGRYLHDIFGPMKLFGG